MRIRHATGITKFLASDTGLECIMWPQHRTGSDVGNFSIRRLVRFRPLGPFVARLDRRPLAGVLQTSVRIANYTELIELRLSIEREGTWDKAREFEEWVGNVDNPERIAPLRTVAHTLDKAGLDAGMGLTLTDGAVRFFHRWQVIVARKQ